MQGLPADVRSQLALAHGRDVADKANGTARGKAAATLVLEMGAMYVMNSLLQDGVRVLRQQRPYEVCASLGDVLKLIHQNQPKRRSPVPGLDGLRRANDEVVEIYAPITGHCSATPSPWTCSCRRRHCPGWSASWSE